MNSVLLSVLSCMSQGSDFHLARHRLDQARTAASSCTAAWACARLILPVCMSVCMSLSLSLSPSARLILLLASALVRADARGNAPPQSRHHEAWYRSDTCIYLFHCLSVCFSLSLSLSLSPSAHLILLLASMLVRADERGNAPPQSRHHEVW